MDESDALQHELTPGEPIRFTLGETEYALPRPTPVSIWIRLLNESQEDQTLNDRQYFAVNMASRVDDVLCWMTGRKMDDLRALPPEEYERVTNALTEQLGEDFGDASPFSPARRAVVSIGRAGKLLAAAARRHKGGGSPS